MPWDTQSIIYTSGTTGPSKGVLCSYLQAASAEKAFYAADETDRNLVNLPMFHAAGTGAIYRMLVKGASVALVESFNTDSFWDVVRKTQSTCLTLLGAMVPFAGASPWLAIPAGFATFAVAALLLRAVGIDELRTMIAQVRALAAWRRRC